MKRVTFESLDDIFSQSRVLPYLKKDDNAEGVIARYHANIALSEAMIPTLHYFEICLRNRIDQVIKKYYGQSWSIIRPSELMISDQDAKKMEEISSKVNKKNRRLAVHDDIVAQMTFGFWCSFFNRRYDPIIWHRKEAIKIMFPNLLVLKEKEFISSVRF